jgi:tetratricopeptide (TPR) repeat protein
MDTPIGKLLQLGLLLILSSLVLNGCAPHRVYYPREPGTYERERIPGPAPRQEELPAPAVKPQRGPAHILYRDAERAMEKRDYKRAEMLLDRALRLEPRNGWYWHAMGRAKYEQGSYGQAIQFCLKSNNLAGQDSELKRANNLLLHKANGKTRPGDR